MAATVAIRQRENSFRNKFHRYTQTASQDPDRKRKAMTAVMAKLARVTYALIKSSSLYESYREALPSGSIPLTRAVGATRTP